MDLSLFLLLVLGLGLYLNYVTTMTEQEWMDVQHPAQNRAPTEK